MRIAENPSLQSGDNILVQSARINACQKKLTLQLTLLKQQVRSYPAPFDYQEED
jgi:hypothetical protein